MTLRSVVHFLALGCITLLLASLYLHWQAGLLVSVGAGTLIGGVEMYFARAVHSNMLREKLCTVGEPYLESGEIVQAVIPAVGGPGPYIGMIVMIAAWAFLVIDRGRTAVALVVLYSLTVTQWLIVATDSALLLVGKTPWQPRPTVRRLPRDIQLGPASGRWTMVWLNGQWLFVSRQYYRDVERADSSLLVGAFSRPGVKQ